MRKIPQYFYSRQRGAAMFVAVALLALAGLGVALSNGLQTVTANHQAQLAATAAPAASGGTGAEEKKEIVDKCYTNKTRDVDVKPELSEASIYLSIDEQEESDDPVCLTCFDHPTEIVTKDGKQAPARICIESGKDEETGGSKIASSCGDIKSANFSKCATAVSGTRSVLCSAVADNSSYLKSNGLTCGDRVSEVQKFFGENEKSMSQIMTEAFAEEEVDRAQVGIESYKKQEEDIAKKIQQLTEDQTPGVGSCDGCHQTKINNLYDELREKVSERQELEKLQEEARRLSPEDSASPRPTVEDKTSGREYFDELGLYDDNNSTFSPVPNKANKDGASPSSEKETVDSLRKKEIQLSEDYRKAGEENPWYKSWFGIESGEQKEIARKQEEIRNQIEVLEKSGKRFGATGEWEPVSTPPAAPPLPIRKPTVTSALPDLGIGDTDDFFEDNSLNPIDTEKLPDYFEKSERVLEAERKLKKAEEDDIGIGKIREIQEEVLSLRKEADLARGAIYLKDTSGDGDGDGDGGCTGAGCGGRDDRPDLGGGLPDLKDMLGPLSELLKGFGGGKKPGGGGMPQPQSNQEKQNDICKEKYPGTSVKDGRCTCPTGEVFTGGKCQAQTKEPKKTATSTSALLAELSCAPKEQGIGAPISISFACRGPEGTTARADGFDNKDENGKEKLSGSAEVKADIEKIDPLTKTQKFAITCIKDGKTETKACEVLVRKSALILVANPSSVNEGEPGKVGWITAGAESCSVRATEGSGGEVDAFNNAHQNITQPNGTAVTPPLSEDMEIVVNCKMYSGESKEESVTVEVK